MESCQLGRETLSGDGYPLADETRPRAGDAGDYASYFQRRQGRRGQTQDFLHIWRKPQDSMKPRAGQSEWSFLKGRAIERLCGCRRHFRHFVEVTEGGAAEVSEVVKDAPHDSGVEAGYPYFSFRVND